MEISDTLKELPWCFIPMEKNGSNGNDGILFKKLMTFSGIYEYKLYEF